MLKSLFPSPSNRQRRSGIRTRVMSVETLEVRTLLAAVVPVISISGVAPVVLPFVNGKQLLAVRTGDETQLFMTDGTQAGTTSITTFSAGLVTSANGELKDYGILGNELFFAATGTNGTELWKTNGTAAGTQLVLDINAGAADSSPAHFKSLGSSLYFAATTAANGRELWNTNGTAGGTSLVADIVDGASGSDPFRLISFDGQMFFGTLATNDVYRTDGTAIGTVQVIDGNFSVGDGSAIGNYPAAVVNSRLIVKREHTATKVDLLALTSATAVPELIEHFDAISAPGFGWFFYVDNFTVANGKLFFVRRLPGGWDEGSRGEVWVSDGTEASTSALTSPKPFFSTGRHGGTLVDYFGGVFVDGANEKLVFYEGGTYFCSWSTDGNSLTVIDTPVAQKPRTGFVQQGSEIFYLSSSLVRVDSGLTSGTTIPGVEASIDGQPFGLRTMLGSLWFSTSQALWKYDAAAPAPAAGPEIVSPGKLVGFVIGQQNPPPIRIDWNPVANAVTPCPALSPPLPRAVLSPRPHHQGSLPGRPKGEVRARLLLEIPLRDGVQRRGILRPPGNRRCRQRGSTGNEERRGSAGEPCWLRW